MQILITACVSSVPLGSTTNSGGMDMPKIFGRQPVAEIGIDRCGIVFDIVYADSSLKGIQNLLVSLVVFSY